MSRLPVGYQELSHIGSTGAQYIDTGLAPSVPTDFEFTVLITGYTQYSRLYGLPKDAGNTRYQAEATSTTNFNIGNNGATAGGLRIPQNSLVTVKKQGLNYTCGSSTVTATNGEYTNSTYHILLLAGYDRISGSCLKARIIRVRFFQNDATVRDLIPCRRISDGAIGMYDLVSQNFFGNSGTGSFVAGAPVIEPTWGSGLASVGQKELLARRFVIQDPDVHRLYLYKHGDECVNVTGGWKYFRYNDITKYPDHIHIEGSHGGSGYGIITTKAINLSGFHRICFDTEWSITTHTGNPNNCGISTRWNEVEYVLLKQQMAMREIRKFNLPAGEIADIVYQCFGTKTWTSNVYNIWLE